MAGLYGDWGKSEMEDNMGKGQEKPAKIKIPVKKKKKK